MIRFINCLRKRPDISHQTFREYWNSEQFNQRMDQLVELLEPGGYARNLTLQTEANERVRARQGGGDDAPYDAIIEYWWDSAADFYDRMDSPDALVLLEQIAKDDAPFIDMKASNGFFTEGNRSS